MKDEFEAKCHVMHELLVNTCDTFLLCIMGKERSSIQIKGSGSDLLFLTHELCNSLREQVAKQFDDEIADALVKTVTKKDSEIDDEMKEMEERKGTEIPDYLKKLMGLDNEEEADTNTDSPDISVRVDHYVHSDDDDGE